MQMLSVESSVEVSGADQRFAPLLNLHESEAEVHKQGTALLLKLHELAH